jgi:recombinational DNA repair protein (RecF pathway)
MSAFNSDLYETSNGACLCNDIMIRYGKNVRLTSNEQSALALLTQSDAKAIETIEMLNRLIDAHLQKYAGESASEKLLRHLLMKYRINDQQGRPT